MISFAEKLFEAIGEISDVFVEEAGNLYYNRKIIKKTIKYGAIGLAASVGFAGLVWVLKSNKGHKKIAG